MNNKLNLTVLLVLFLAVFTSCQKEDTILEQELSLSSPEITKLKDQLKDKGVNTENINEIITEISGDVINTTAAKTLCTDATGEIETSTIMRFKGNDTSNPSDFLWIFRSSAFPTDFDFVLGVNSWDRVKNLDCGTHEGWVYVLDECCAAYEKVAYKKVTYVDCF